MNFNWQEKFSGAITLCDENFIITYMNDASKETFKDDGGAELIGKNLLDCHNENSRKVLRDIVENKKPNIYTIEKAGMKKLIYQAPLFEGTKYTGLVELSIQIPFEMQNFLRD